MRAGRWLFVVAAAVIAGLALHERLVRLPVLPFADADGWGYIRPAVLLCTEGRYFHTAGREFVYPVFLHGVLRLFGTWSAVPIVQHVLGVLGGLVLLTAWMRIPLPARAPEGLRVVQGVLGLGLLAAHLFLAQTMSYEHLMRPEAISQPALALLLLGAVGLLARSTPARAVGLVADATLLVGSAALLAALRPQTLLVLPAALIVLGGVLFRLRPRRGVAALAVALPLVLCTAGIWVPERVLAAQDPVSGRFMSGVLFFWHFHLVDDVLEEDLREGRLPAEKQALVRGLLDAFAEEKSRHATEGKWYDFQGYNPDALYYGRAGRILHEHFGEDTEAYEDFTLESFRRAVLARPLGYAEKIRANLASYYGWPGGRVLNDRLDFNIPRDVRTSLANLEPYHEELLRYGPAVEYIRALEEQRDTLGRPEDPRTWVLGWKPLAKRGSDAYAAVNVLHVPLLLAALALIPFASRWDDRALAEVLLLGAGLAVAANLTSAAVHGLETMRYVYALAALSLFTQAAAALFVATRAWGLLSSGRRGRPRSTALR